MLSPQIVSNSLDLQIVRHVKILEHLLETILGEAAGVAEVAGFGFPILEAAVVEGFEVVCDDEGDDAGPQAFLEQQQAADAAVAVLEGNRHPTNILLLVLQSWVNSFFTWREQQLRAQKPARRRRGRGISSGGILFSFRCRPGRCGLPEASVSECGWRLIG